MRGRPGIAVGGTIAGRYEVRGPGFQAAAYHEYPALDRDAEVEVALWLIDPELFGAPGSFEATCARAAALSHPGLRRIFAHGTDGEHRYVAVEAASGVGLSALVAQVEPSFGNELVKTAAALGAAASAGVAEGLVHGRMTPTDVVVVAGTIKLGGLGLFADLDPAIAARKWSDYSRYLAPEVLSRGTTSPRADVYSLAAILIEVAAGREANQFSETIEELAGDHLALADLLSQALAGDPAHRPSSAAVLVERLARVFVDHKGETVPRDFVVPPEATRDVTLPVTDMPNVADLDEDLATVEEASPLFLHPSAAPKSPLFGPNQQTVMGQRPRGGPPQSVAPPRSADQETVTSEPDAITAETPLERPRSGEGEPRVVQVQSRKVEEPPGEPREPVIAAIDRPELQPVLRPLSSVRRSSVPPGSLGNYAPPRTAEVPRPKRKTLWLWVGLALVLSGGAAALAVVLTSDDDSGTTATADAGALASDIDAGITVSSPVISKLSDDACPAGMVLFDADRSLEPYCIDAHESPGKGQMPSVAVELSAAERACASRAARLCSPDEWEAACRGTERASFPYGARYIRGRCNTRGEQIDRTGAFATCVSAAKAYDMSGNAAEWDSSGAIRGGSATDRSPGRCSAVRRKSNKDLSDVGFRCCADPLAPVGGDR